MPIMEVSSPLPEGGTSAMWKYIPRAALLETLFHIWTFLTYRVVPISACQYAEISSSALKKQNRYSFERWSHVHNFISLITTNGGKTKELLCNKSKHRYRGAE